MADNEHEQAVSAIWEEMTALIRAGEQAPPALAARVYRLMTDAGDRLETRTMLHVAARMGDEWSSSVLDLLADDPWWPVSPRVLETWPEPS